MKLLLFVLTILCLLYAYHTGFEDGVASVPPAKEKVILKRDPAMDNMKCVDRIQTPGGKCIAWRVK